MLFNQLPFKVPSRLPPKFNQLSLKFIVGLELRIKVYVLVTLGKLCAVRVTLHILKRSISLVRGIRSEISATRGPIKAANGPNKTQNLSFQAPA